MKAKSVAVVAFLSLCFTAPLLADLTIDIESVDYEPNKKSLIPGAPKGTITIEGQAKTLVPQVFGGSSLELHILRKDKKGLWKSVSPKPQRYERLRPADANQRQANKTVDFTIQITELTAGLDDGEYLIVLSKDAAMAAYEWTKGKKRAVNGGF